jgi:hypothetical protein
MRGRVFSFVAALLLSTNAYAQAIWQPTAPPIVTAESATWLQSGEPVTWDGVVYVAAGAMRPFNGNVMVRSGVFRGIPLYTDGTLEANTVVLVPMSGGWMQPYERRAVAVELSTRQAAGPPTLGPAIVLTQAADDSMRAAPVAVSDVVRSAPAPVGTSGRVAVTPPRPVTTVIPPTGANTIWVNFDGRRWYAAKSSIEYDAAVLNEIGTYQGWTVYAMKSDPARTTIYIPAAPGRLAAYSSIRNRQ